MDFAADQGGELGVVVDDAARRRRGELLDRAVHGARREDPVVAGAQGAAGGRELHLDPVLEGDPGGRGGDQPVGADVLPLVPAPHPRVARADLEGGGAESAMPGRRDGAVEGDRLRRLVGRHDERHLARLPLELADVVEDLHPVVLLEAQHRVAADAPDGQLARRAGGLDLADRRDHGGVLPRPLEARRRRVAAGVDLHPIELVLETAVAAGGRQDARVVARRRGDRAAAQPAGGRRQPEVGAAVRLPPRRHALDLDLPDGLPPRRRIDAAERLLEQVAVLDPGHLAVPDVDVDQGVAGRQRIGGGIVRLMAVGDRLAVDLLAGEDLGEEAVDVEAAGADP